MLGDVTKSWERQVRGVTVCWERWPSQERGRLGG